MEGIKEVRQLTDKSTRWVAEVGLKEKEWTADGVEKVPDVRVAWRNTSGAPKVVSFEPVGADRTKVTARMTYYPETFVEKAGDFLGVGSTRVLGDLERFKAFIEGRGKETGAWRGEIRGGDVRPAPPGAGS